MVYLVVSALAGLHTFAEPTNPPFIPEGYRAYSIKVDVTQGGAFIEPGKRVDVIHVVKVEGKNKASIIVSDRLVIAVDTFQKDKKTVDVTVTLAVKPEDALKLAAAQKDGTLRIAVRAPNAKP
jgi:Flp pilus assembly protein CpaB